MRSVPKTSRAASSSSGLLVSSRPLPPYPVTPLPTPLPPCIDVESGLELLRSACLLSPGRSPREMQTHLQHLHLFSHFALCRFCLLLFLLFLFRCIASPMLFSPVCLLFQLQRPLHRQSHAAIHLLLSFRSSPHLASPHLTSPHLTSPHLTSLRQGIQDAGHHVWQCAVVQCAARHVRPRCQPAHHQLRCFL